MEKERKQFDYTIEKHLGTISANSDYSKELCRIRWKGGSPKLDFRMWKHFSDEEKRLPLKGVSLDTDEAETLKELLNNA